MASHTTELARGPTATIAGAADRLAGAMELVELVQSQLQHRIHAVSYAPDDGTGAVLMAAAIIGLTTYFVFSVYGLGTTKLEAVNRKVSEGLDLPSLKIS